MKHEAHQISEVYVHKRIKKTLSHAAAWLAVSAAFALTASLAFATVAIYMDLNALVERADVIVQGKVKGQRGLYDKDRQLSLVQTTIKVDHTFHGEDQDTIIIQQIGGEHDGTTTKIAGDAKFAEGEEVVLFLKKGKEQVHYLTSLGQAKWSIKREGKTVMVSRDLTGFVFVKPGEQGAKEITEQPTQLRSFTKTLEQTIKQVKGAKP